VGSEFLGGEIGRRPVWAERKVGKVQVTLKDSVMDDHEAAGATENSTRQSEDAQDRERRSLDVLKDVGRAITSLLGKSCEVVIHDTSDLEHSIVWVEGDVTGRREGDVMTDLGLERLRRGEVHPLFNYTLRTDGGKTLKCASIWLRDARGEICGAFCINLDVTPILILQDFARDLSVGESAPDEGERHGTDLGDMLDTMIAECEYRMATSAEKMKRDQRIDVVRFLEERGAFQVRNSAAIVAERLGVTRKTIYNYLREIERQLDSSARTIE
jgi:predicted transcriptional regulator YheO